MAIINGINANLADWGGRIYLRATNWWNLNVSDWVVDPANAALQAAAIVVTNDPNSGDTLNRYSARAHNDFKTQWGIPYIVVDRSTPRVSVTIQDTEESDYGPYPIPAGAEASSYPNYFIENGYSAANRAVGDEHLLMIDREERIVYELDGASYSNGKWYADYGAIHDLKNNARRPEGWTSVDAAGLCVAAGLITYDEVYGADEITHALRFALKQNNGYVWPASHDNNVDYPGAR